MAQGRHTLDGPADRGASGQGRLEVHPGGPGLEPAPGRSTPTTTAWARAGQGRSAPGDVGLGQAGLDRLRGDRRRQGHLVSRPDPEEEAAIAAAKARSGGRGTGRASTRLPSSNVLDGGRARTRPPARRESRRERRTCRARRPRVVLGVCGGIAAYKAVEVCRRLVDAGVHVVPGADRGGHRFVGEVTFSPWPRNRCSAALGRALPDPAHPTRAGADLIVVAPATAHLLGPLRRRVGRRPPDGHPARHPGAGAGVPGHAHRDVGAPGGA